MPATRPRPLLCPSHRPKHRPGAHTRGLLVCPALCDSAAREQWEWHPEYDFEAMVDDMLENLTRKLTVSD